MKLITCFLFILFASSNSMAADAANGKKLFGKINCAMCHNKDGLGKAKMENGKSVVSNAMKGPRIAGLNEEYIAAQLTAIQGKDDKKTRKTKYTASMKSKIGKLTEAEMKDLAAYVSKELNSKAGPHKGMLE